MQKRTIKVALLVVIALLLVLGFSGTALAKTWSDLPATVTAKYGVTNNQVAAISDGFTNGTWKPYATITRQQYTKMLVLAFNIPLKNPATPSFTDVPKTSIFYQYIEGAKAAGILDAGTTFSPLATTTRVQAIAWSARYIADVQGYDLATMYTPAEITGLLAHFGDAASIPAEYREEVAFAFDFGITNGNAFGNLAPADLLSRIQGAVFLIRAQTKVPPAQWTADKIEIVSGNGAENLIGKTHTVTFKVTDAAGHPAVGVLVDFDTLYANPLYVGNVSPQAAVTDSFGQVKVNLVSHEPGTQKVSATVKTVDGGLATQVATKYWVALDEIYIMDTERWAENNAGDAHEWSARVVVIGPGPRSTSQFDWYNVIDASFDPANLNVNDGVWESLNDYGDELALAAGYVPRTMAGIGVKWTVDWTGLDDPTKGVIVAKDDLTDAAGTASITIKSTSIGEATVQAMAWYPENPYPQMLLDRDTADPDDWDADDDWEQQPKAVASATKLWIPHIIGGDSSAPITPAYAVNNTGEVEEFVLELKDVYGNPIKDYQVEWWIQGVGFFKTDESTWVGVGEQNKDIDVTDKDGKASVWVKSEDAGQTIVHCKVMDKYGLPWKEWNVVKQWYAVDFVTMDNPLTAADESVASNPVGTSHTFNVWALGWKYVYVLTDVNHNGLRDDAVLLGDRADIKAATGDVLKYDGVTVDYTKAAGEVLPAGRVIIIKDTAYTNYTDASAITEAIAWVDSLADGVKEAWHPLQGKGVNFFTNVGQGGAPTSDTALATVVPGAPDKPYYVGSITSAAAPYPERTYGGKLYDYNAVTDAGGKASVTITSTAKGSQWVYAVVDYPENPQGGDPTKPTKWAELNWDSAVKTWIAGAGTTIRVFNAAGDPGNEFTNPILPYVRLGIDDIIRDRTARFSRLRLSWSTAWNAVWTPRTPTGKLSPSRSSTPTVTPSKAGRSTSRSSIRAGL